MLPDYWQQILWEQITFSVIYFFFLAPGRWYLTLSHICAMSIFILACEPFSKRLIFTWVFIDLNIKLYNISLQILKAVMLKYISNCI